MSQHSIPIVDLADFLAGGEKKQDFVFQLGQAFESQTSGKFHLN
jgi:hypothetical protein